MRVWKWVGLAGVIGVAGVGAAAIQRQRRRSWTDYDPDELRDRLHARLAEGGAHQ